MTIRNHIRENPATVPSDTSIREAAKQMEAANSGFVIAVGPTGRPLGVLTDRDIAMRALRRNLDMDETTVDALIEDELVIVSENASLTNAMRRMRSNGVRRLPVVDGEGALIGVFDWNDALHIISGELHQVSRVANAQA